MRRTSIMASFALALGVTAFTTGCGGDRTTSARNDQAAADRIGAADRVDTNVSPADREFMTKAAQSGMMEVEAGRIAQEKGRSQAVKNLAQRLVEDHSAANDRLKQIATDLGVTLPATLNEEHQEHIEQLNKTAAARFDAEFRKQVAAHHQKDIEEFQNQANNGQNERLKSFAADNLPKLREHLQMAQSGRKR